MSHSLKPTCLIIYALMNLPLFAICQTNKIIREAEDKLDKNTRDNQVVFDELISMIKDSSIHDSIKVEIIHFFEKYPCDSCISFLTNHIDAVFLQRNDNEYDIVACYTTLVSISRNINQRWNLLHPILNSLKQQARSDRSIQRLGYILIYISNKEIARSILEFELMETKKTMIHLRNTIYEKNLILMLNQF